MAYESFCQPGSCRKTVPSAHRASKQPTQHTVYTTPKTTYVWLTLPLRWRWRGLCRNALQQVCLCSCMALEALNTRPRGLYWGDDAALCGDAAYPQHKTDTAAADHLTPHLIPPPALQARCCRPAAFPCPLWCSQQGDAAAAGGQRSRTRPCCLAWRAAGTAMRTSTTCASSQTAASCAACAGAAQKSRA